VPRVQSLRARSLSASGRTEFVSETHNGKKISSAPDARLTGLSLTTTVLP
jgi:hypothetical protein